MNHKRFSISAAVVALVSISALAMSACSTTTSQATAAQANTSSPPVADSVQDLHSLARQAADAYIAYQGGKTDFTWSVAAGIRAYQGIVQTAADFKRVAAQYTEGRKAGLTFAQQLAQVFASSPAPPAQKAAVIAKALEQTAAAAGSP